jgi:CHAD domain-containing protein
MLEQISDHLGPLRDNYVHRKTLGRLNTSRKVRSFSRFLEHRKSDERKQLEKFFRGKRKRDVHERFDRIERKLQRLSKNWTAVDYRAAFEKVLRRRYESLIRSQQEWKDGPDNKRFHRMRVEVRDLRYASETIAEVLGLSRTRDIQTVLKILRALQTSMGNIHDIHKLRTELVAWINDRPAKKRASEMTAAAELQHEFESRMVEFEDHSLASEDLLLRLQVPGRRTIRATAPANSHH